MTPILGSPTVKSLAIDAGPANITTNGVNTDPSPAAYPYWCSRGAFGAWYVFDRFHSCQTNRLLLQLISAKTGTVVGTASIQTIEDDTLAYNNQNDIHVLRVNMYAATGVVSASTTWIYTFMQCYSDCTNGISASPADQETILSLNRPLKGTYTVKHHDVAPFTTTAQAFVQISNTVADNWTRASLHSVPNTLCDQESYMLGTAGCTFPEYVPTFSMSLSDPNVAKSAAAIWQAQQSLADHWGANYTTLHGKVLSRVADQASRNANTAVACAGFKPLEPGDTCDEYPFESTYQGAAFVGRSRVYVASIPGAQNSLAGSRLGQFFLYNRVIQDSDFWVGITN